MKSNYNSNKMIQTNIADILQDKSKGTKLYSPAFGEVQLDAILGDKIYCIQIEDANHNFYKLTEQGQLSLNGECMLFPSKIVHSWEKFQWKKGDVLVDQFGNHCIFKNWSSTDYTKFTCLFPSRISELFTINWVKEIDKKAIEWYISYVKKVKGGKLNIETLEIERSLCKDGEILVLDADGKSHHKIILLCKSNTEDKYEVYSFLNTGTSYLCFESTLMDDRKARLATEEEKQQLFNAFAKKGKAWNTEMKQIVDLPKKQEFKPFDRVLVRISENDIWVADLFSHYSDNENHLKYSCVGATWKFCIPYNENTAHLLGTTDNWKGDE